MNVKRLWKRAYHLGQRVILEGKRFPRVRHVFGNKIAVCSFVDGIIPPGKSPRYIAAVSEYVDRQMADLTAQYAAEPSNPAGEESSSAQKLPIWCCWWQGEESMPELVRLCHIRLKQVLPMEKAELHLITLENYRDYVDLPEHIVRKFEAGVVTMTTMSDVLRFHLLERYGGYWLDATVFFTGDIPDAYFSGEFYCQKMVGNKKYASREACGSRWCGFSMAGPAGNIVFRYMKDAFSRWWAHYDMIIDYVLIDYLLLSGYRHVPAIRSIIDQVPDNNEDIFEMYQVLNQPYTPALYQRLTAKNVMHKLTYKMDLMKETPEGQMTLYGYLLKKVYENC